MAGGSSGLKLTDGRLLFAGRRNVGRRWEKLARADQLLFFGRKFACGVWAIDKRPAGGRPAFEPANGEINDN